MQRLSVPSRELRAGPQRRFTETHDLPPGDGQTWLGGEAVAGQISERHGRALYLLACIILGDRDEAETAAVRAIAQACTRPGIQPDRTSRQDLAHLTYRQCLILRASAPAAASDRSREVTDRSSPLKAVDELRMLAHNQRAALALIECGTSAVGTSPTCLGCRRQRWLNWCPGA